MMKTIYKSVEGKNKILELYDSQLARLGVPYKDIFVDTTFGKTHLVETGMPSNVSGKLMQRCKAPTLVMAAEKDCLFPGERLIRRAQEIIPNCTTYLIKGRGHLHYMTDEEKEMIRTFLK